MSEKNEKYGGWISVKDKLPETSNCVLITDGENVEMSRYDEGVWHTESPCCYGEILYWQPLPDISEIYLEIQEKEQKMDNLINNTNGPTK